MNDHNLKNLDNRAVLAPKKGRGGMRRLGVLILAGIVLLLSRVAPDLLEQDANSNPASSGPITSEPVRDAEAGALPRQSEAELQTGRERILQAWENRESEVWVEADGHVIKLLRDDLEGSRHQKFLVALNQPNRRDEHTLLISHNIDLARRVPLREGDRVVFRGRYEWNDRGGVIHWTHHDPRGRRPGGWITHDGRTYR